MSRLVTGEAVALELRPAAVPSRVLAAVLDGALQLLLLLVLGTAATFLGGGSEAGDAALVVLVLVLALVVYPVAFETALRGRTPGKAALGLRAVRDDGGPIGFRQALVRGLAGAFLERPGVTLFFGGLVCALLHPSGKRIGDLLAGTVVLQERVPSRGGIVAVMPPPLAGWAASLQLSGLPDALALQARQFLSRSGELSPAAREDLGARIVTDVVARISPPPPADAPGWAVLAAVLAERTRRAQQQLGAPGSGYPGYPGHAGYPGYPGSPGPAPVPAAAPPA
ncbi:MAG: domain containing protein, partial [Frankiales bacterium]|nr:domain containing protein [Frankiales bacterium]